MSQAYDVYGGWTPTDLIELAECEADPYITPTGVTPEWVTDLKRAAERHAAVHGFWWHHTSRCTDARCKAAS